MPISMESFFSCTPTWSCPLDGTVWGSGSSGVELEELADGVQLAAGGRRHHGDRRDTDLVPGVQALADLAGAAADRAVVDPGVRHQPRQRVAVAGVDGVLDGLHL